MRMGEKSPSVTKITLYSLRRWASVRIPWNIAMSPFSPVTFITPRLVTATRVFIDMRKEGYSQAKDRNFRGCSS